MNKKDKKKTSRNKKRTDKSLITGIITPLLTSVIVSAITAFIQIGYITYHNKNEISETKDSIAKIQDSISNKYDKIDERLDDLNTEVTILNGNYRQDHLLQKASAITVRPSSSLQKGMILSDSLDVYGGVLSTIKAKPTDLAAVTVYGRRNLSFKELISKTVVVHYKEGNQDVYFCGQYDDNMRWDGNCLINVYHGDKLKIITESTYIDGVLIAYNQVFSSEDDKEWINSSRSVTDNGYWGTTQVYNKEENYTKKFKDKDVSGRDLFLTQDFIDEFINPEINERKSYYKGYTSNGLYNDNTGKSYLIKFDSDGYVITLYRGNFKDGNFNDTTGNAWEITRNARKSSQQKDMKYMYYVGKVYNGNFEKNKKNLSNLSQNEIDNIVGRYIFDIPLKWKQIDY